MNSRERVFAALKHEATDRVPISFGGTLSSGILQSAPPNNAYDKLCKYLNITEYEEPQIGHMGNFVYNIDERITKQFGSDFTLISTGDANYEDLPDGSKRLLGLNCGIIVKNLGIFDDIYKYPLKSISTVKEIKEYPFWPTKKDYLNAANHMKRKCEELTKLDTVTVADLFLIFPYFMYPMLTGFEKWFIDMKIKPDFYFAFSDHLLSIALELLDYTLPVIGEKIDIICTYDDLGTQQGMLCSLDDYRSFLKPYDQEIIKKIKNHSDAYIYRHSCGSVYPVIKDFIEMGVEILNPIQTTATGMDPSKLKNEFGKDLSFFGGVDTQDLLSFGSPLDVKNEVISLIETLGKNGGYVFGPSTNIGPNTPPENIVAMYETALNYSL